MNSIETKTLLLPGTVKDLRFNSTVDPSWVEVRIREGRIFCCTLQDPLDQLSVSQWDHRVEIYGEQGSRCHFSVSLDDGRIHVDYDSTFEATYSVPAAPFKKGLDYLHFISHRLRVSLILATFNNALNELLLRRNPVVEEAP